MRILFTVLAIFLASQSLAAVCSRTLTFADGSVLTATQLNDEFNTMVSCVNSIDQDNIATNANISPSVINAAIAGDGISRNGSTGALAANVDSSTIEISSDIIRLKDGGITNAKIADGTIATAKLASATQEALAPVGSIMAYAASAAPSGWLLCDGSAVNRVTYAALFALIGTTHGQGDGSSTFNLPDYRGRFLRMVTGGSANDPDASSRTAMATGGNTGNNVGSVQDSIFASHNHGGGNHGHTSSGSYGAGGGAAMQGSDGGGIPFSISNVNASGTIISTQGGNETRPINAYVKYIIKY